MKNAMTIIAVLIAGIAIGVFVTRGSSGPDKQTASDTDGTGRTVLYWKAPMDPNYRRDEPGKSPMGMNLVPVYANGGDDDESVVRIRCCLLVRA